MNNFFIKLGLIFKDPLLRRRALFTVGLLVVFRLLATIPIPGVDLVQLQQLFANNQFLGLVDIFSGGGFSNLSIMMLGVSPFITATIIMQLLTMVFPKLKAMYQEEGESGGMKVYGVVSTYLPLRLNQAGVIPIIFALSILLFPQMIVNFLATFDNGVVQAAVSLLNAFLTNVWLYSIFYFLLVVIFTYFYTAVTFDPHTLSTNLQKNGAFVPGVRPGQ